MTDVASIRENDVTAKLTSSLEIDAVSILTNDITVKLTSSLATDVASICKNNAAEKLLSNLETDVLFINDSNVAAPKLKPRLETDVVYFRQTNAPDLTLTTNIAPVFSLLPFSITVLLFSFHYITGIYFTYHQTLSQHHTTWIKSILPLLQLLIYSFHLKYIFLFSCRDPNDQCTLESLVPFI